MKMYSIIKRNKDDDREYIVTNNSGEATVNGERKNILSVLPLDGMDNEESTPYIVSEDAIFVRDGEPTMIASIRETFVNRYSKFKLYDVVKKTNGYWGDKYDSTFDAEEYMITAVSYPKKYNDKYRTSYSIVSVNSTGGGAWWLDDYLEFVRSGSKEELDMIKKRNSDITILHSNIDWIIDNYPNALTPTSMISLFREIGFHSKFEDNGEFFVLLNTWHVIDPIFQAIFKGNLFEVKVRTKNTIGEKYLEVVEKFYHKVNDRKENK